MTPGLKVGAMVFPCRAELSFPGVGDGYIALSGGAYSGLPTQDLALHEYRVKQIGLQE